MIKALLCCLISKKGAVPKKTDAFAAFFNFIIVKIHCQWKILTFYHIKGIVL